MPDVVNAVKSLVWIDSGTLAAGRRSSPQSMTLVANACARGKCRTLISPKTARELDTACARVSMAGTSSQPPSPESAEWRALADRANRDLRDAGRRLSRHGLWR